MSKKRVHELAKELKVSSKEMVEKLHKMNINVSSHMSTLEDGEITRIRKEFGGGSKKSDQPNKDRKPRPEGDRKPRPEGDRKPRPQGDRKPRPQGDRKPRPEGDRKPRPQGDRKPRPEGDRKPRPQGDRKPRPEGDRKPRPQGDRKPRPQGDRRPRPEGDRKPRPQGDRKPRPQGDRRPRPDGDRRPRPQGGRPQKRSNEIPKPEVAVEAEKRRLTPDEKKKRDNEKAKRERAARPAAAKKPKTDKYKEQPNVYTAKEKKVDLDKIFEEEDRKKERHVKKARNNRKRRKGKRSDYKNKKKDRKPLIDVEYDDQGRILIDEFITVADLALTLGSAQNEIIMKLMGLGIMATVNQEIDFETAELIAAEFEKELAVKVPVEDVEAFNLDEEDKPEDLKPRAPIVTVMGHVDHGKTSLLDAIRTTNVTDGEAGGITQHIGASEVVLNNKKIVFLDTPGHEAFTTLRARGAQVTDVAILVVAADDGVMPQTKEAIDHAKAAGVPIIVAINKIDKENANPDRVKQELADNGILIEEWGGDVICVPVSALKRQGIEGLLEMVLLVAEMQELKANPNRNAVGTVIEAKVEKGRGPVSTILIEKGTLKIGDSIIAGPVYGRVRAMYNHKGVNVKEAGPATAVEITGLNDVPQAGDKLYQVKDDKLARSIVEKRKIVDREESLNASKHVSLEDLFSRIQEGEIKDLNIIIKADVHGSVEALRGSLLKITNEEVKVNIVHASVGTVTESDILLASASDAIIIGFNVRPSSSVKHLAEQEGVDLKTYRIIYNAIDDVESAMKGMLSPVFKEQVLGHIEVRATFKVPNIGVIAGGYVQEGKITRNAQVRLAREGIIVHEGKISSLKRFKDDVREVATGFECGIGIENYNDIKEGDIIEAFEIVEVARD